MVRNLFSESFDSVLNNANRENFVMDRHKKALFQKRTGRTAKMGVVIATDNNETRHETAKKLLCSDLPGELRKTPFRLWLSQLAFLSYLV